MQRDQFPCEVSVREEQIGAKRICRKCLTADMDEKAYFESLHTYIENLDADLKVKQDIYEKRLAVCKECDLLADGMCRACGCFVELRAVVWKNSCPYDKWTAEKGTAER
ncbi:MAG: hypothetical protein HFI57_04875 [Lachnospiraceae bacterium]|nr:hypothetical protein [Lachnospiraceae bacterium]